MSATQTRREQKLQLPDFLALQSKYNNRYLRYVHEAANRSGDGDDQQGGDWRLHQHLREKTMTGSSNAASPLPAGASLSFPGLEDAVNPGYMFTVIPVDSASTFVLPRYVAFKDSDGRYLAPHTDVNGRTYLQFVSTSISDEKVWNEVYYGGKDSIRIRSMYVNKFWKSITPKQSKGKGKWILADVDPGKIAGDNSDTVFKPVRIKNKTIALFNTGRKLYCQIISKDKGHDYLAAAASSYLDDRSKGTHLQVEECVKSRQVYDVYYHLDKARIYNEDVVTLASQSTRNDVGETLKLGCKFTVKISSTRSWKTGDSFKIGGKVMLRAGIPVIKGSVEINGEFSRAYEWGEAELSSYDYESSFETTVEKDNEVCVTATATLASCDIPYSYTQHDILPDGTECITRKDDGICTATNHYDFKFNPKKAKILILPPPQNRSCRIRVPELPKRVVCFTPIQKYFPIHTNVSKTGLSPVLRPLCF
ncbi:hypothetical protein Tsubulata_008126 [Turnera subulata]|uniref:Agglutinin domain-containing protein n=1 Tax=Turnera subulata TaxID=218843 RepID=A0A9Q0G7C7_9ROSI|nr:hypothetical protein Tsubulata_008126 [Turnera subulata]